MTDIKQEPAATFPSPESVNLLRNAATLGPAYDDGRIRAAASALIAEAKSLGMSCERMVIEVKVACRTTLDPAKLAPEVSTDVFTSRIVSHCIELYYAPEGRQ